MVYAYINYNFSHGVNSQLGGYFVTICVQRHACVFGNILNEEMQLSPQGLIAQKCWNELPNHFDNVLLDEYITMPNHIHGIIILQETDNKQQSGRDVQLNVPTRLSPKKGTLPVIVRTYKAAVTTQCRQNGYDEFKWQSCFYKHIIRDERDLSNTRQYILNNPLKWNLDDEYSENNTDAE